MSYVKMRQYILLGWAVTIVAVIAAFMTAFLTPQIRPDPDVLIASISVTAGLLIPQLTIIYEFFLSERPTRNSNIDRAAAYIMLFMCATYWLIFICAVWAGVVFRAFISSPDGNGLQHATSIIVSVAAVFSGLAIKPTVKLFLITHDSGRPLPER